ncbi:VOC family protein [Desemzia sp. FAM 23989]|uniref:VOC family protein n=1 Tax=Desemzia sp. FAM 23989 TaxID=3259523 RepID=UPI0038875A78
MKSHTTHEIAYLGHVEILTPKLNESMRFFVEILGMEEVKRENESVYLRCWRDWELYSVILTASEYPGIGHTGYRTASPEILEQLAEKLEIAGFGVGWTEGDYGHGKSYQFRGPDGHLQELYYETEKYAAPLELKPFFKNQPQKYMARGVGVKHLDHINFLSSNPPADGDMMEHILGMRLTEQIQTTTGSREAVWYSPNTKSYEVVYTKDATGTKGRFHHIAFEVDSLEEIARAADIFNENGIYIEFAPSKHAINQTYFVYCYEPGGNRIEIASGGYHVLEPEWDVISWNEIERARGQAWGNPTVAAFHTYGTPVIEATEISGH